MELTPTVKVEGKERRNYPYDVVFVLGGGVKPIKTNEGIRYVPIDFISSKDTKHVGSSLRTLAAAELYLNQQSRNFIFSGGQGPDSVAKYGSDIPTEAEVYKNQLERILSGMKTRRDYTERLNSLEEVEIGEEGKSTSTETNIQEILRLIHQSRWSHVAIVSNRYHIERVRLLCAEIFKMYPEISSKVEVSILPAEDIIEQYEPGKYDGIIEETYKDKNRQYVLEEESGKIAKLKSGEYKVKPFDI